MRVRLGNIMCILLALNALKVQNAYLLHNLQKNDCIKAILSKLIFYEMQQCFPA